MAPTPSHAAPPPAPRRSTLLPIASVIPVGRTAEAATVANVVELTRADGPTALAISNQPAWARTSNRVAHLAGGTISAIENRDQQAEATALRPAA